MSKLFAVVLASVVASLSHAQTSPRFAHFNDGIVVVCPSTPGDSPMFMESRSGHVFPIVDMLLRAVAAKACEREEDELSTPPTNNVSVTNSRSTPIYVSFTTQNGRPGPILWATNSNCQTSGVGVQILAGQTCMAFVPAAANSSRFCASLTAAPANCWLAQTNHQTMIETTFLRASNPGCFKQGACVWYDISLIPSNCTDSAWKLNKCAGTGGAAYNLPVQLDCSSGQTYTCQGPVSSHWGSEMYPSNCGDPNATCTGNAQSCVNAYFFPMFTGTPAKHQPNSVCTGGNVLGITFLSGS
jgi:hypothetical protein